jgi:cystathionine beta-lyase family protein involved in aluminum resistance
MFYLQKSRGYAWREALSYEDIRCLFALAKEISPKTICFVDNCYGELVDEHEMGNAGADLFAGSLIKNPGGGLARTGGYICGRADLVERAAERLSVPGLSMDMGATGGYQELFYQGLFLAPHVVGQALQGAVVSSRLFELLGFETMPIAADPRHDIVQAVRFQNAEQLLAFCRGIQAAAPVDAHAVPEPEALPGYADPVVMAAGTFVLGASIELSADAPLRPPYTAYMQGGLTRSHAVFGAMMAAENVLRLGK